MDGGRRRKGQKKRENERRWRKYVRTYEEGGMEVSTCFTEARAKSVRKRYVTRGRVLFWVTYVL